LAAEVADLIGDAARALQAGLEEIMPRRAPARQGVIFSDADQSPDDETDGPARKLQRWLGSL
jgi:hypothetical protein